MENFGDVGSLEDNVESFLHDGGDGNIYGSLKQSLIEHKTETSKGGIRYLGRFLSVALCSFCYKSHDTLFVLFIGFSFGEVGCIRTRNKVTCCHFSSDGKLLASAGHDKKVVQLCLQMLCINKTGMFNCIFWSLQFGLWISYSVPHVV